MKHPSRVTAFLLALFFIAQLFGILLIQYYTTTPLPYALERPVIPEDQPLLATGTIIIFIILATALIILLARFKLGWLWKLWFGLAVALALSITFSAFLPGMIALLIAVALTLVKLFKNNAFIHNLTELFTYAGIGAIFAPVLTPLIMALLLIGISLYDIIAVRATKHMITLAEFQTKQKLFAGFVIPYKKDLAILGGGDVVFPLLFAGVLLPQYGLKVLLISLTTLISLAILFYLAKKKTYYPAMPFVTAGCFVGYGLLYVLF